MGTPRFTPEFKEEAVRQITERGYSVAEVSDRLGVSAHSLYKWLRAINALSRGSNFAMLAGRTRSAGFSTF